MTEEKKKKNENRERGSFSFAGVARMEKATREEWDFEWTFIAFSWLSRYPEKCTYCYSVLYYIPSPTDFEMKGRPPPNTYTYHSIKTVLRRINRTKWSKFKLGVSVCEIRLMRFKVQSGRLQSRLSSSNERVILAQLSSCFLEAETLN